MSALSQRQKAEAFRHMHQAPPMLVLPNVWDAASARIVEQVGVRAIATTSSGAAASLGYPDGERMSAETMLDAIARIVGAVACPVTADIEAGYSASLAEKVAYVEAVIATGAVGVNIEDSAPGQPDALVDASAQVELIAALRALAATLDIPFVINARVDAYLHSIGAPESRFDLTVERGAAYLRAGADCIYPIGRLDPETIGRLVKAIPGPINIMATPPQPTLPQLASLGVARVSLAGGLMRAALGHIRAIARDLLERESYDTLASETLSGAEFSALFADRR